MRDMLFVSHANPEDNAFARWISLQLANERYGVWCDLTKLLGGERFWDDIDDAIRHRTAKFLFVLSKISNTKESPRDELELALNVQRGEKLRDFIIPLWLDDLRPSDFYVRLQSLNAIPFRDGWRHGLVRLLEKLEKDSCPKAEGFGPPAVRTWWSGYRSPLATVRESPEPLLSNWHAVAQADLYLHSLTRPDPGPIELPATLPYPGTRHNQYLVTFATADDIAPHLGPLQIESTRRIQLISARVEGVWTSRERNSIITNLLNQAWKHMVASRGLPIVQFANEQQAFYFRTGMAPDDRVEYFDAGGTRHWRNVVGTSMQGRNPDGTPHLRYWHFAFQARGVVSPRIAFMVKPHVVFSDDGFTPWNSVPRLHRARRSHCRTWWNDRWRDLLLGTLAWLAQGRQQLPLPVGRNSTISFAVTPLRLESPVSYDERELEALLEAEKLTAEEDLDLDEDSDESNEEGVDDDQGLKEEEG